MPITQDGITPEYELGNLVITAWPDNTYSFEEINLTIARCADGGIKDIYDAQWKRADLVAKLKGGSIEDVLKGLSKEDIALLETEKIDIIKYVEDVKDLYERSKKTESPAP
jgi:hypothetical protein